jgi:GH24 family phage-related lysozyme (muramidase)
MTDPRKPIFDAVRAAKPAIFADTGNVLALDNLLDAFGIARAAPPSTTSPNKRQVAEPGQTLIKRWESCGRKRSDGRFEAYPDPGSADGKPWTIGWGSTGPDVTPGTIWTQAQCDERFARDLQRYADEVSKAIGGARTTQSQFDALVSFHYNTGKIASATLTKKHIAGDYAGARAEFGKWVNNDGQVLRGLVRRRAEEAEIYGSAS